MANEHMNFNERLILAKIETTAGSDASPTPADNTAEYTEFAWQLAPTLRERNVITPYGPGARHQIGLTTATFSAQQDLLAGAITAADGTDDPNFVTMARYNGWSVQRNLTDKTVTLFCEPRLGETASIYERMSNSAGTDYNQAKLLGAIGNWSLELTAGNELLFNSEGQAVADTTYYTSVNSALSGGSLSDDGILRAEDATFRLYNPTGTVMFGGGSLASPGENLDLISLTLDGNRDIAPMPGVTGSFGVKQYRVNQTGRITGTMRIWAGNLDEWNMYTYLLDANALYFGLDLTPPGAATTTVRLAFWLQPTGAVKTELDGFAVYDVPFAVLFPADGDGDPAAGVNPEQAWNDDTANIGLIDDTNITPPAGAPIFIQVHTT